MKIAAPLRLLDLLSILEGRGYAAYAVGGCVRDSLLGRSPADWDIATNARPEEVKDCFGAFRVLETGLKHGTVTVVADHIPYEVTTFRVDGEYSDNRRPDSVSFTSSLEDDLARRDFTVNAMAWNPRSGLIDPFGGAEDLARKRIACVGDPAARFGEDALRILRAVRFASVLDFSIESRTADAVRQCAPLLDNVARERVRTELDKALLGAGVGRAFGEHPEVVTQVIPELAPCIGFQQNSPHHHLDVWGHILDSVAVSACVLPVRLALLLHDAAKPHCYSEDEQGLGHFYGHSRLGADLARGILTRLRSDTATREQVVRLIDCHDSHLPPSDKAVRRWLGRLGEEELRMLLEVKRGDIRAHASWCVPTGLEQMDELERVLDDVLANKAVFRVKDLAVNGGDLLELGFPQGRELGNTLKDLLELVMDERLPNEREALLDYIRERELSK